MRTPPLAEDTGSDDGALAAVPKIIETPSPEDCSLHRQDLQALRRLLDAPTLPGLVAAGA